MITFNNDYCQSRGLGIGKNAFIIIYHQKTNVIKCDPTEIKQTIGVTFVML